MRAKLCSSKGDTCQTGKWFNRSTEFSVEQAVLLKLISLFKFLSTQHNCTIYFCYFWLIGVCKPLVCWHDFGHLYWKLAFKHTYMHALLFPTFFFLFFYQALNSEGAAWDLQRTVGNTWDQRKVLIQQVLLRLQ